MPAIAGMAAIRTALQEKQWFATATAMGHFFFTKIIQYPVLILKFPFNLFMHVDKCPNVLWKYFFKICLAIFQNYVWNGYAISSIALPPQKRDLLPKYDLLQIVHSFSRFLFEQFFPQRTYSTVSSRPFSTFATSMHTKTDKNELMGKGRCGSVRLRLKREGRRFDIQWALSRV